MTPGAGPRGRVPTAAPAAPTSPGPGPVGKMTRSAGSEGSADRVRGVEPMFAVISSGGKQYRVEEGQQLAVERLGAETGEQVELRPVLVVDGAEVLASPRELSGSTVRADVVGEERGPKIRGFTYKPKSNQRRRWGHRQHYSTIRITAITKG